MRKIATILILLTAWLFFGTTSVVAVSTAESPAAPLQVTASERMMQEMLCESEYNSDLGLPRTLCVESPTVVQLSVSPVWRLGLMGCVVGGQGGCRVCICREFLYPHRAGGSGVAHSLHVLRRLII